jgi:hypothetical protein
MASELLSSVAGGGGGAGVTLAEDLTFPSSINGLVGAVTVSGIDGSSGLTTALSLTGKFIIDTLIFTGITLESMTFKLTVDGTVIWNDTFVTTQTSLALLGDSQTLAGGMGVNSSSIQCNSSLLLEIATTADTSVDLSYLARPIV